MNVKAIICGLLATTAFGAGAATVAASGSAEAKIEQASAGSTTTLYINHFDGGGTWANFSYYLFGGSAGENAGFPGVAFTDSMKTATPNEYDQYQYVLEIDTTKYAKLILVGNPSDWGGSRAQTEDLVIADMTNNGLYCGSQKSGTNKFNVNYYGYTTKSVYLYDIKGNVYNNKHYVHTWANGKSGTSWPGVEMTKVSGSNNIYKADINAALGNVIFNNNGSNQTATISGVTNGDTYIVYPDNGYNKSTLEASTFVDKYMKFETRWLDDEGNGACKNSGWYASAKSAFSALTSSVKTKVLEHEPTKYRLEAWAKANGDTFNTSTGVFSSRATLTAVLPGSKDNTILIVVIASLISISAFATFLFIRKKRLAK